MRAPKARAKILGYFPREQHMTSSFSNSRGCNCPRFPHPPPGAYDSIPRVLIPAGVTTRATTGNVPVTEPDNESSNTPANTPDNSPGNPPVTSPLPDATPDNDVTDGSVAGAQGSFDDGDGALPVAVMSGLTSLLLIGGIAYAVYACRRRKQPAAGKQPSAEQETYTYTYGESAAGSAIIGGSTARSTAGSTARSTAGSTAGSKAGSTTSVYTETYV